MNWKYIVIRKMKPSSVKNATVTAPLAAENRRFANRLTSSIGSATRRSHATNATSATADDGEARERGRRAPSPHRRLDDRVDEQTDRRRRQRQTATVETRGRRVARRRRPQRDEHDRDRRGRNHGQEDAAPPEVLEQPAARRSDRTPPPFRSSLPRCRSPSRAPTRSVNAFDRIDNVFGKTIAAPMPITARAAIS